MPDIFDAFAAEQDAAAPEPAAPMPEPQDAPAPDIFASFAQEQDQDRQVRIKRFGEIRRAMVNPDERAAVLSVSRKTGAPPDLVEHELPFWRQRAEAAAGDDEKFYAQNPELARIALDNPFLGEVITKDKPFNSLQYFLRGLRRFAGFTYLDDLERAQFGAPQFYGDEASWLRNLDPARFVPGEIENVSPPIPKQSMVKTPLSDATGFSRLGIYTDAAKRSFDAIELGWLTMKYAAQLASGTDTYETEKAALDIQNRSVAPDYQAGPIEQIGLDAAQFIGSHAVSLGTTLAGGGVAKLLGAGAKGAAAAGFGSGFLSSFVMESSNFWDYKSEVDDQGRPVDPDIALAAALGYASVAALIETDVNVTKWVPFLTAGKEASRAAVKEFLGQIAKDPVRKVLLRRSLREWAKVAASEGIEEASQNLAQDIFSWMNRSASAGKAEGGMFSPQRADPVASLGEAFDVGVTATVGAFVMGGAGAAKNAYLMDREARQSIIAAQQLKAINAAVPDSPTVQAAPVAFAQMVTKETEESGAPVEAAFIDPAAIVTLAQEQHLDPTALLEEAIGPDAAKAFTEALASGNKMRVELGDYVDVWHKSGLADALIADTATRANGVLTPREMSQRSKEFQKEVDAEVAAMEAEAAEGKGPSATDVLLKKIADELVKAQEGISKTDAKTMVAVWRAIIRTEAVRNGLERDDVAKMLVVRVAQSKALKDNATVQGLTQAARDQTQTPEFKAWFGDSKVVDESGKPLVVAHGTAHPEDFGAFAGGNEKRSASGNVGIWGRGVAYFGDLQAASDYAVARRGGGGGQTGGPSRVIPVYLALRNPFVWSESRPLSEFREFAKSLKGVTAEEAARIDATSQRIGNSTFRVSSAPAVIENLGLDRWTELLKSNGYDGVIVNPEKHGEWPNSAEYVAFAPEQIKSAIGNRGTFDPNDPNILHQSLEKSPGPRGWMKSIVQAGKRIIDIVLTDKADLSTFLHESGHAFWELKADLAERPDAPQAVKDDYAAALKWMGVKDRAELADRIGKANAIRATARTENRALTAAEKAEVKALVEPFEKWARAFEAYLMTGKAPSLSLAGVFAQFKLWLLDLYRHVRSLNVALDPEITGIFDRMLATDAEIEKASRAIGITGEATEKAKTRAEIAAMKEVQRTHEAWWKKALGVLLGQAEDEYENLPARRAWRFLRRGEGADDLKALGEVKLDYRAVADIVGIDKAEKMFRGLLHKFNAKTGDAGIHPDQLAAMLAVKDGKTLLEAMVSMPEKAAWVKARADEQMAIRHPGILEERQRLSDLVQKALHDEPAIVEELHKEWAEDRREAGEDKAPSVDAARAAARVLIGRQGTGVVDGKGYARAEREQMVKRALAVKKRDEAKRKRDATKAKLDEAWAERKAWKAEEGETEAAARKRMLSLEEKIDAASKAAIKADNAYKEAATAAALASQRRLLNFYLWKEADRARASVEKTVEVAGKMLSAKGQEFLGSASPVFRDMVLRVLERTGFVKDIPAEAKNVGMVELREALDNLEPSGEGATLEFDAAQIEALLTHFPKSFDEMSISEADNLLAFLQQIRTAAREKTSILVNNQRVALDAVAGDVRNESSRLAPHVGAPRARALATLKQSRAWETGENWIAATMDPLTTYLDDEWLGPTMRKALRDRYYDARKVEDELLAEAGKKFLEAYNRMPKSVSERLHDVVDASMLPYTGRRRGPVDRAWMLQILANMGNESNMARLLGGYGWTKEQVLDFFKANKLTAAEADFVQSIWDLNDKYLWPKLAEVYERVKGSRPKKIEASPLALTVDGGQPIILRGGYYPAIGDPIDSRVGKAQEEATTVNAMSYDNFRASLLQGFTKGRVEGAKYALRLDDFAAYPAHVARVIRYIAYEEYVRDANRLLLATKDTIEDRLGSAAYVQLDRWLKVVASGSADSVAAAERGLASTFGFWVNRTVITAMLFNLKNALADFSTPLLSMLGAKGQRIAPWRLLGSLVSGTVGLAIPAKADAGFWAMRQEARSKSKELQSRHNKSVRQMRKAFDRIAAKGKRWRPGERIGVRLAPGEALDWIHDHGFVFQETAAVWGETVVWNAAYHQALAKTNGDEAESIRRADDAIQKNFPADRSAERSHALRSKGALGALFIMQGFFNRVENKVIQTIHPALVEWGQAEGWLEKGKVAGVHAATTGIQVAAILAVVQLIGGILEGRGPEPGEEPPEWVKRKMLAAPFILDPVLSQLGSFVEAAVADDAIKYRVAMQASERSAPAVSAIIRLFKSLGTVADENKDDDRRLWAAYDVVGLALGLPVSQVKRTVRGVTEGDASLEHLIYGPPPRSGAAAGNLFDPFAND